MWIRPGGGLAEEYVLALSQLSGDNPEATILVILAIFAAFHSGLAGLRPTGEKLIGARAYRVLFALVRSVWRRVRRAGGRKPSPPPLLPCCASAP